MSLTDEAVAKIRQMIASGELGSGDRLPPEKELSEQLGLSRGSLREAVKALEMINVLSVRRGDGTYVTSLQPAMLRDAVSFMVELQRDSSILDLMAVRRVLEASAAALAAPRITEAQVAELRANVDDVDPDDVEDVVGHDMAFHHLIAEVGGNGYLTGLLDGLASSTVRARLWRGITQKRSVERTLNEHRSIVDALAIGDPRLAESAMIVHIGGVENWIRRAVLDESGAVAEPSGDGE